MNEEKVNIEHADGSRRKLGEMGEARKDPELLDGGIIIKKRE